MTIEERSKIVQDIVKKYPGPDKEYCPEAAIYWRGKNKEDGEYTKVYFPTTGQIEMHSSNDDKHRNAWGYYYNKPLRGSNYVVSSTRNELLACYAKYHKQYDCIELGLLGVPANRGKQGEIREWEFTNMWMTNRVFLFYGQPEVFKADGSLYRPDEMGRYYNKGFINLLKIYSQQGNETELTKREFNKFSKNAKTHSGSWENSTDYIWGFIEWYKVMIPRKTSENSKKIASLQLDDLDKYINEKYKVVCHRGERSYDTTYENDKIMAFRKTSENEGIFRYYTNDTHYDDTNEPYYVLSEKSRIVIDKNGKPTFLERNGTDDWKISSCSVTDRVRGTDVVKDGWEQMSEVSHLKYIKDMIDDQCKILNEEKKNSYRYSNFNEMGLIVDILRHPILEKLYKSGYKELSLAIRETGKITASIKETFNGKDKKTGSLKDLLGVNNYQLQKLEAICKESAKNNNGNYYISRRYYSINNIISMIKQITGLDNIAGLSKESTDKYFTAAKNINNVSHNWRYAFLYDVNENGQPHRIYSWSKNEDNCSEDEKKKIERVIRLGSKEPQSYRVFADTVGSFCSLNNTNRPNINLYDIDSFDELLHVHDALNELLSQQRIEERMLWDKKEAERHKILEERMEKLQEHRIDVYEEIGEEFSVIVPRNLSQLTTEGTVLSHCVSGYIQRYATGDTNILFVRKNDKMTTPFYTLEVNGGECIQLHGFANKWAGNNPEIIPFLKKWFEDRNIKYRKEQLLDKSLHYCASGDLVDGTAYGL